MFNWNRVSTLLAATGIAVAVWACAAIGPVLAIGQPYPGQIGLSEPATAMVIRP